MTTMCHAGTRGDPFALSLSKGTRCTPIPFTLSLSKGRHCVRNPFALRYRRAGLKDRSPAQSQTLRLSCANGLSGRCVPFDKLRANGSAVP